MGGPEGRANVNNRAEGGGAKIWASLRMAWLATSVLLASFFGAPGPAGATQKPLPPGGGAQAPAAPGISSVPMVPTPPPQAKESFTRYRHHDLAAGDQWESKAWSAEDCEAKCQANRDCGGYTYDGWNERCFLKRDLGELRLNPRASSGVLASQPQPAKSSATVVMKYYNNRAFPGGPNLTKQARNRDECERLCWGSSSCIGFSFYRDQRLCYLYNDPAVYGEKAGVFSGAKEQPAQ